MYYKNPNRFYPLIKGQISDRDYKSILKNTITGITYCNVVYEKIPLK
ncbi:hypothetical protein FHT21_000731 [Pedobacter sp. SG908]|nr:hypothetical protein [Pedobacter sp. SG908]NMN35690.1 hypothetical protein [Pedobacter sp. SG918]